MSVSSLLKCGHRAGDIAPLCTIVLVQRALDSVTLAIIKYRLGTEVYDCNSSISHVEKGGSEGPAHSWLPSLRLAWGICLLNENANIYHSYFQVGWSLLCKLIEVCPGTLQSLIGPQDIGNDWEVLGIHR